MRYYIELKIALKNVGIRKIQYGNPVVHFKDSVLLEWICTESSTSIAVQLQSVLVMQATKLCIDENQSFSSDPIAIKHFKNDLT
jgi:hypothetical protein